MLACVASAIAWLAPDRGMSSLASGQDTPSGDTEQAADQTVDKAGLAAVDYGGLAAIDPLARARAVAALGDSRVLAQLAPRPEGGGPDPVRALAAIRSSPWLIDPSHALAPLFAVMNGRDPDLAPAAAQAAVEVARGFVEAARLPESVTQERLAAWIKELSTIELSPRARADIRLASVEAAALLGAARERL
jgi:hypothetical protein